MDSRKKDVDDLKWMNEDWARSRDKTRSCCSSLNCSFSLSHSSSSSLLFKIVAFLFREKTRQLSFKPSLHSSLSLSHHTEFRISVLKGVLLTPSGTFIAPFFLTLSLASSRSRFLLFEKNESFNICSWDPHQHDFLIIISKKSSLLHPFHRSSLSPSLFSSPLHLNFRFLPCFLTLFNANTLVPSFLPSLTSTLLLASYLQKKLVRFSFSRPPDTKSNPFFFPYKLMEMSIKRFSIWDKNHWVMKPRRKKKKKSWDLSFLPIVSKVAEQIWTLWWWPYYIIHNILYTLHHTCNIIYNIYYTNLPMGDYHERRRTIMIHTLTTQAHIHDSHSIHSLPKMCFLFLSTLLHLSLLFFCFLPQFVSKRETIACSSEEFQCDRKCVPASWRCDGKVFLLSSSSNSFFLLSLHLATL